MLCASLALVGAGAAAPVATQFVPVTVNTGSLIMTGNAPDRPLPVPYNPLAQPSAFVPSIVNTGALLMTGVASDQPLPRPYNPFSTPTPFVPMTINTGTLQMTGGAPDSNAAPVINRRSSP